jgi:DNA-binding SARP family transcriptional activator
MTGVRCVRLALLNGFELICDGTTLAMPLGAQRLLAFLALRDHPVPRPFIAGTLWPDTPDRRSSANLRSSVWRVHRPGYRIIDASDQEMRLAPDVEVDVRQTTAIARLVLDGSSVPSSEDFNLLCLAGDLLPGVYDEWTLFERERFRQLRLHALETVCERFTNCGMVGQAVQAGLAAVAGEPLRESAQRVLIRAHLIAGNQGEAVRQYEMYRVMLWDELQVAPSAQMDALLSTLRASTHNAPVTRGTYHATA